MHWQVMFGVLSPYFVSLYVALCVSLYVSLQVMFGVLSPYFTAHFVITPLIFYALFGQVKEIISLSHMYAYVHVRMFAHGKRDHLILSYVCICACTYVRAWYKRSSHCFICMHMCMYVCSCMVKEIISFSHMYAYVHVRIRMFAHGKRDHLIVSYVCICACAYVGAYIAYV